MYIKERRMQLHALEAEGHKCSFLTEKREAFNCPLGPTLDMP